MRKSNFFSCDRFIQQVYGLDVIDLPMDSSEAFKNNRALWNAMAEVHVRSKFYDVESFIGGRNSLSGLELELLGDVIGKNLLHLQCHFGQDTLSLARMGATVTGLDLSDVAIEKAREL